MSDASRDVHLQGEIVQENKVGIVVALGNPPVIDRVAGRLVEVAEEVGVSVAKRVEHRGADAEQTVVRHSVIHHRAEHRVDGVPVHTLDVEKDVLLVHSVPEIFEYADGVVGLVFCHKGAFAGDNGQCHKTDEDDIK